MKNKHGKFGFSLIELLVAMALIVAIVAMIYGSYSASLKSARACKSKLALFQQGRNLLRQMAQQIRCSYAPELVDAGGKHQSISFFDGDQDNPSGEILHLITAGGFLQNENSTDGLFEVAYKFDKNNDTLFLSRRRFISLSESAVQQRNWRPVANNVSQLDLAFFDGRQWLKNWSFSDSKGLPSAVKLDFTCENETNRQYHYGTTVYLYCRNNQEKETHDEILAAIKKQ